MDIQRDAFLSAVRQGFPPVVASAVERLSEPFGERMTPDDIGWVMAEALLSASPLTPDAVLVGVELIHRGSHDWLSPDEAREHWLLRHHICGTFAEAVTRPVAAGMGAAPVEPGRPLYRRVGAVFTDELTAAKAQFEFPDVGVEVVAHYGAIQPPGLPFCSLTLFCSDALYVVGQLLVSERPSETVH